MQTTTQASSQRSLRGLLLRRLRDGIIVLLLVVTIIFVLAHVIGNPALVFAPVDATDEHIAEIHRQFGLDRPVTERYWEYLTGLARLDFGESTWQQRPAINAVTEALPATIVLTVVGLGAAAVLGVIPGVVAGAPGPQALRQGLEPAVSDRAVGAELLAGAAADPAIRGPTRLAAHLGALPDRQHRVAGGHPGHRPRRAHLPARAVRRHTRRCPSRT